MSTQQQNAHTNKQTRGKRGPYGLKENSKKVLDIIATQKKRNASQAYKEVHPEASDITARANAHQLLKKPEAQIYLQKHIDKAKKTIVELLDTGKDEIKLRSAQDILDREHGKATQKTEVQTTGVTLSIDLTSRLNQDTDQD